VRSSVRKTSNPNAQRLRRRSMRFVSFEPTRQAGLDRLSAFVPSAGRHYQNTRNADFGPVDRSNISALSPYIRHRLVTEEEVLRAVLAKHSPAAAEKFIQEVFWRTYFKGHLETRPQIWTNYRAALQNHKLQGGLLKAYETAIGARTGIDCFDAWVNELVEFGYLHNHARMWFASIWIFTLRLPWELGADFMYRHLLDGDPASNTLSWRWVAGLHTKGKTYLARADNIETYTQGRFSPKGLAHYAEALEETLVPSAQKISSARESYSNGKIGLLLTEEDLNSETWAVEGANIVAIAGASADVARSELPVSTLVTQFTANALNDGMLNASQHFNAPYQDLGGFTVESIADWAKTHGINTIVTAYAPVGPVADVLSDLIPRLKDFSVELIQVRRAFDSAAWPHGNKGFFAMKEKIPRLLTAFVNSENPQMSLL
jgi:deoxyribodipyrimidine photo-lyase